MYGLLHTSIYASPNTEHYPLWLSLDLNMALVIASRQLAKWPSSFFQGLIPDVLDTMTNFNSR